MNKEDYIKEVERQLNDEVCYAIRFYNPSEKLKRRKKSIVLMKSLYTIAPCMMN